MASITNVSSAVSRSGGSGTCAFGFTATQNRWLVLAVRDLLQHTEADMGQITGWTRRLAIVYPDKVGLYIFTRPSDGTETTVTYDWAAGYTTCTMQVFEIGGFSDDSAIEFDVITSDNTPDPGSNLAQGTGTSATMTNNEGFALAVHAHADEYEFQAGGVEYSASNGFTMGNSGLAVNRMAYAYLDISSAQTVGTTFTVTSAGVTSHWGPAAMAMVLSVPGSSTNDVTGDVVSTGNGLSGSAEIVRSATGDVVSTGNALSGQAEIIGVYSVSSADTVATGNSLAGSAEIIHNATGDTVATGNALSGEATLPGEAIIIDHDCTNDDDDEIPLSALATAAAQDIVFGHQSVGDNILVGMETLRDAPGSIYTDLVLHSGSSWQRPTIAWYTANDGLGDFYVGTNTQPLVKIQDFEDWMTDAQGMMQDAAEELATVLDVGLMKLCFVDITSSTDVAAVWAAYQSMMEGLIASYPDVIWVWSTAPLNIDGADLPNKATYNGYVRNYVNTNGGYLFDIAAIESHQPDGTPVTSGGYESMFVDYAVSGSDPHLGADGQVRLARAMHWLLARTAGWDGVAQTFNDTTGDVVSTGNTLSGQSEIIRSVTGDMTSTGNEISGDSEIIHSVTGDVVASGNALSGQVVIIEVGVSSVYIADTVASGNAISGAAEIVHNATGNVIASGNALSGQAVIIEIPSYDVTGDVVASGNQICGASIIIRTATGNTVASGNQLSGIVTTQSADIISTTELIRIIAGDSIIRVRG